MNGRPDLVGAIVPDPGPFGRTSAATGGAAHILSLTCGHEVLIPEPRTILSAAMLRAIRRRDAEGTPTVTWCGGCGDFRESVPPAAEGSR